MKITVLVDNNTIIDNYLLGEPGVSFFIEEAGKTLLFDLGYSDVFLRNAQKLNINLSGLDYVAISHGHNDHTRGLKYLMEIPKGTPKLLAHPQAFEEKYDDNLAIGAEISIEELDNYFDMNFSKDPYWITDKLVYLGEIERTNDFENKKPVGMHLVNGIMQDDYVLDDTALAYKSKKGLVIITGCSHSGICNIIEYAKKVCGEDRIFDVLGGFHLLKPATEHLKKTIDSIKSAKVKRLHACHCTDFHSKLSLSKVAEVYEVGSGLVLEFE